jgi:hypothetical protein
MAKKARPAPVPVAAVPYALPTIAATMPTVYEGITYGEWAVIVVTVIDHEPGGNADSSGPHGPLSLYWQCAKGRTHPDGYFEKAPVDSPQEYRMDSLIAQAQNNKPLQKFLNDIVDMVATQGKNAGLL